MILTYKDYIKKGLVENSTSPSLKKEISKNENIHEEIIEEKKELNNYEYILQYPEIHRGIEDILIYKLKNGKEIKIVRGVYKTFDIEEKKELISKGFLGVN